MKAFPDSDIFYRNLYYDYDYDYDYEILSDGEEFLFRYLMIKKELQIKVK